MSVSRRAVLRALAAATDAEGGERVSVSTIAEAIDADETVVRRHLTGLAACHLASVEDDRGARITITGEELLALDVDGKAIVGPLEESRG